VGASRPRPWACGRPSGGLGGERSRQGPAAAWPLRPPPLRKGDRAFCLLRDTTVVITSWTAARIPWPRCRTLDGTGGGSGILLDEEVARAVRWESAAAVCYWWGISDGVVWRWRRALGVTRTSCEGTRRLTPAAAELGAAALRGKELPPE
jgi:hypothetical protein